jgi:hypothetical protein
MMKMMQRVCLSVMIGLAVGVVSAQQWFVSPAGSDDPNGSFEQPFETIQQALNAAQDGDTIVLMPGVYSGQGNYDLSVDGLSLTIRSTQPDDWDTVEATVIDPQQQGGIFMFTIPDQGRIILEGLTFQNAFKEGKLSLLDLFDPPYYEEPHGAAIFADGGQVDVRFCVFTNCLAALGGAVYFGNTQATVSHCIFVGNEGWHGGALIADMDSEVMLDHCTLAGNWGNVNGGAAAVEFGSTLAVSKSIFWGNDLIEPDRQGTQIYASDASSVSVWYTVVQDGADGTFAADLNSTILLDESVLEADPLFASFDAQQSPFEWDVRLLSMFGRWDPTVQQWVTDASTSPCIVAGPSEADYSREPWPNGRRANIGAYGNTAQASMYGNIADLNIDGRVDLFDVAQLSAVWMDVPVDYEDFDHSGVVDIADILILAENWLWQM